jgi:hypothetical protein
MAYKGKNLLIILAAAITLLTAGMKEIKGQPHDHFAYSGIAHGDMGISGSDLLQVPVSFLIAQVKTGLLDQLWLRFGEASLIVKVLLVILIYLILSVIILFITILVHRQIKANQYHQRKQLQNEYQEQLAGFLFDEKLETVKFRGINKRNNRQLLINEIMELHNNLHGEVADKLRDLYFNLNLHKDSLHNVHHGRWDKQARGFGELAQMNVKDANDKIRTYINSKNNILRTEAQVALVKLSDNDPLGFLDELQHELSYWEQVKLYDTMIYHQIEIDAFDRWLFSNNPSVVIFALRMISLFKHVQSGDRVRELLFSDNPDIALAAIKALKALELSEFVEDTKILFRSETLKLENVLKEHRRQKNQKDIKSMDDLTPRKIRFEIVSAMMAIATENEIPFLEQVMLDNESSYKLRLMAIAVMLSIRPGGAARLDAIMETGDDLVKKMIINAKQNQES